MEDPTQQTKTYRLVPDFILERFGAGEDHGGFPATALFVDIGGFSAITDSLMQHGQHGAEVLAGVMKAVFEPLTQAVYSQGGFITGFAGDAFTAVFPHDAQPAALPALAAAMRIQEHMQQVAEQETVYGRFNLSVKVGGALGEVIWGIVSAADGQRAAYYFQGSAIDGGAAAEKVAQAGDVILDPAFFEQLPDQVAAEPVEDFHRITAVHTPLPPPQHIHLPPVNPDHLAHFFPPAVTHPQQSGEFRQVVHLFISLPTIRSEAQLRIFMQTVFSLQAQYGGLLNRLDFGDKGAHLLMFWGVPISHENDIQRALHFILDLQTQTAIPINGGITYQIAHAGFIGSSLRGEYTCHGRGANLAARFMTAAPRGEIWVDQAVARRAGSQFELEFEAEKSFKGFAEPQKVYVLYERKDAAEPLYSGRLVGREAELRRLRDFVQPLDKGLSPGTLVIWGEPGAGKSRLAHEFLSQHLPSLAAEPQIFLAQTDEILRQPFNPLRYWLKNYFGLAAGLAESRHKRSFNRKLDGLIASTGDERLADELDRIRSCLGALVGLRWPDSLYEQLDAQGRYSNTLSGLITLLQAESRQQPVILFLEDAHWLDEDSAAFLSRLLASLHDKEASPFPIAVLATARLERAGLPIDDIVYEEIHLGELTAADLADLAVAQLDAPVADDLLELISERAEGNPFFAEQILRYLQDAGQLTMRDGRYQATDLSQSPLPEDVSAILVARLDRLSQEVREVVQTAAVLGREFEARLLSRMLAGDAALPQKMMQAEQEAIWSALSEIRYIFRHTLLRDAAYRMQLRARRQALHRLAMEAIEAVFADNLAGHYGELAYHATSAELHQPAFRYHLAAGDEAMQLNTAQTAVNHYETAWQVAEQKGWPEDLSNAGRQNLYTALGRAYELIESWTKAADTYRTMIAYAQSIESAVMECQGLNSLATVYYLRFKDKQQAVPLLERAKTIAEQNGDRRGMAESVWNLAMAAYYGDDHKLALHHAEQALDLSRDLQHPHFMAQHLSILAYIYIQQQKWDKAEASAAEASKLYTEAGNLVLASDCDRNVGIAQLYAGKPQEALATLQETIAFSRKIENLWGEAECTWKLAYTWLELGDYGQAIRLAREGVRLSHEVGLPMMLQLALTILGVVQRTIMALDAARETLADDLMDSTKQGSMGLIVDQALTELCAVYAITGDWNRAYDSARQRLQTREDDPLLPMGFCGWYQVEALLRGGDGASARAMVERLADHVGENRRYRLILLRSQAVLAQWDGDVAQAISCLEAALVQAQEIGLPREAWPILGDLGKLYSAQGEPEKAQQAYQEAGTIIHRLAETIDEGDLRAGFLTAVPVRSILEKGNG